MFRFSALCFASIVALGATAAQAAPVVFDLGAGTNTENQIILSDGGSGLVLTVNGFSGFDLTTFQNTGVLGSDADINRNASGWAIGGGLTTPGEAFNFSFGSETVSLLSVTLFELDGAEDTLDVFSDLGGSASFTFPADPGADVQTFMPGSTLSGSDFAFVPTSGAIRIQQIVVDFDPAAVSEPASVALLGAGLMAFGAARRRLLA